ncbi:MAG: hypothetical protein C4542_08485 [Dehalococcoidia bacterium]|nr:MAG: hypothetical protein C4542_08485 [Dehalococcoidia bacterium]
MTETKTLKRGEINGVPAFRLTNQEQEIRIISIEDIIQINFSLADRKEIATLMWQRLRALGAEEISNDAVFIEKGDITYIFYRPKRR